MLRTGKICASLVYNYLTSNNEEDLDEKSKKLKSLSSVFSNYGGLLSKLSQILCLEYSNNVVFSDCSPFSREDTDKYFKKKMLEDELFNDISCDLEIYKSGSIGQVYRAIYNNKEIVLKVQYVGLEEQIKEDLKILNLVSLYLYNDLDLRKAFEDVRTKIFEELDYMKELENHTVMYELYYEHEDIIIPDIYIEKTTDKILAIEYMDGFMSLNDFINNSSQEDRNIVGKLILEFVIQNIYNNNILYSDSHYGNFLVKNNKLCVLDFGCLHFLNEMIVNNLKDIHKSIVEDDKYTFLKTVEKLEILNEDTSEDSREYCYEYFKIQYEPFTTEFFEFTKEWLDKSCYKNIDLMKEWNLPSELVYFNKIPYGLYHVLTNLNLKGNFTEIFVI